MLKFGRIDVEERMDGCGCGDVLLYLGGVEGVIILLFFSLNSSLLDLIVFFFFACFGSFYSAILIKSS